MDISSERAPVCMGLLAHVDAGKTTLSEALLYQSGALRTLGRVDHKDAYLDTHGLERARGITIFSKQARFSTSGLEVTLIDTPGHVDFSAEAERTLPILDFAVLVINSTDGVQAHTATLWQLLARYEIPAFLFINKMDLPGKSRQELMQQLQKQLSAGCLDFSAEADSLAESIALCDETLLESYLHSGTVATSEVQRLIAERKIFPCCFGSALKLEGVDTLLNLMDTYAPRPRYPEEFGAKVYKISRDAQGNRLTWLKITGGSLKTRTPITYEPSNQEPLTEKVLQLRLYSGDKFTTPETAPAGTVCALTGLSATWAGQVFGVETQLPPPVLEPVMTYRINLPAGSDPATILPLLRQLEEEDPQLHITWDSNLKQLHAQIMGKVQLQVLRSLIAERFGLEVNFSDRKVYYKETILAPVEGVGHFEPLRHYAEVHLLLEPLPAGSGLIFDTACSTDILDLNYQRLILSHLSEKTHLGVLTGAPITDMKITLLSGRAHIKHTEGGDFRQATYRAVRQGLMQADSQLLEPWYAFTLILPADQIGRGITDIRAMGGEINPPDADGNLSVLTGLVPAAEIGEYAEQVSAYTQGQGQLRLTLHGYAPCHNAEAVIAEAAYQPEADLENTPDSVFCGKGAGFTVKWNEVFEYMHLSSTLKSPAQDAPVLITRNLLPEDKELEAIMEREFGPIKRPAYRAPANQPAAETFAITPPRQTYLIVDGYNIIFAWEDLAKIAAEDLDAARRALMDTLSSYAGFKKCRLVLVFDGYKRKDNPGEKFHFHNIQVAYTPEGETADAYIESLVADIGKNYAVRVATSDALVQLSSLRSGVLRMSARELLNEIETTKKEMRNYY